MTEKLLTFKELADWKERDCRTEQRIAEEKRTVMDTGGTLVRCRVGHRNPLSHQGWDSTYWLYPEDDGVSPLRITVRATLGRKALEEDIRSQIVKALAAAQGAPVG